MTASPPSGEAGNAAGSPGPPIVLILLALTALGGIVGRAAEVKGRRHDRQPGPRPHRARHSTRPNGPYSPAHGT
ncbi:hypothetical protein GCM10009560_24730 [Nonomuraea longicatena]|uniref:Uncharacterized protein n=1 Tax=Nonomuraea longicatena TaxID=83682 RepID=A0ABN1P8Q2_9ACTN